MIMLQLGSFLLYLSICLIASFIGGYIAGKRNKNKR